MTQPPQNTAHTRSTQPSGPRALSHLSRCITFLAALLLLRHSAGLEFGSGLALLLGGQLRRFCFLSHGACQQNALQAAANACAAPRAPAAEARGLTLRAKTAAQCPPTHARGTKAGHGLARCADAAPPARPSRPSPSLWRDGGDASCHRGTAGRPQSRASPRRRPLATQMRC